MTQAEKDEILSVLDKVLLKGATPPELISFGVISKKYGGISLEQFNIDAKNNISMRDNFLYAALSEIVKGFTCEDNRNHDTYQREMM